MEVYTSSLNMKRTIFNSVNSLRYVAAFLFCVVCIGVGVAASVRGRVKDSQGEALTGVVVSLKKNEKPQDAVLTDSDGKFLIESLDTGKYDLQFTFIGMDTVIRPIDVHNQDSVVDIGTIEMRETGVTLAETVVTGGKDGSHR